MTPEDRAHLDGRFDRQDALLLELRDRTTSQNERIKSLESTRSAALGAIVLAAVAFLGSATMWAFQLLHISNKP